jgi:hypothetical protein
MLFSYLNSTRTKCYLANALIVGLYGAVYVIFRGGRVGKMVGAALPGPALSILLTLVSLGIFPGVILPVLAFKLRGARLGVSVLLLDIASLVCALLSGAILVVLSVALWAHAVWLVAEAENGFSIQYPNG